MAAGTPRQGRSVQTQKQKYSQGGRQIRPRPICRGTHGSINGSAADHPGGYRFVARVGVNWHENSSHHLRRGFVKNNKAALPGRIDDSVLRFDPGRPRLQHRRPARAFASVSKNLLER